MKHLKMVLVAALCLVAFSALASAASAVTITQPAAGTKLTFTSTNSKLTAGFGTVSCTNSQATGTVTNTTGTTVTNPISALTWSGCSASFVPGTADVNTAGTCSNMTIVLTSGTAGYIDLGSGCYVHINVTGAGCTIDVTRTGSLSTARANFSWSNASQDLKISQGSLVYDASGGLCGTSGTNATFTGDYIPNTTVTIDN